MIVALVVNDCPVGCRRKKSVYMQAGGAEAFQNIITFKEHGFAPSGFPMSKAAVALFPAEEDFDSIPEKWMVRGNQGDVFPGESEVAIKGYRKSILGEFREILAEAFSFLEDITSQGEILDLESEIIEETNDKFLEIRIMISIRDMLNESLGAFR
jgi:hypothetical protein